MSLASHHAADAAAAFNDPDDPSSEPLVAIAVEGFHLPDGHTGNPAEVGRLADQGLATGFRSAPLLMVVGEGARRKVLLGRWHIWLDGERIFVDAAIVRIADESSGWERAGAGGANVTELLTVPFEPRPKSDLTDRHGLLASLAKEAAEQSRNGVAHVRSLRLELEEGVAASLGSDQGESPSRTVPLLINLGVAMTQARHEAREAVREGLWLWSDDPAAYHAYRRGRDTTLAQWQHQADTITRPWMGTHDSAIRHCESMTELLGEEVDALTQMVQAAGAMAQIHDAESADTLNKVASAAAVGIGLPSLGLAYYGADRLFVLNPFGIVVVLGVILVPTVFGIVASMVVGRGSKRYTAVGMGVLVSCLLLCLILPTIVSKALHLAG